jgi:hypothetical protein
VKELTGARGMGGPQGQMLANAAGPTPLARDSIRSFKFLRSIPCDVSARIARVDVQYGRQIRPAGQRCEPVHRQEGYFEELDARERVFNPRFDERKKAGKSL